MRQLILLLLTGFLFAGCSKKTDELFDKPVDARLQEALTAYKTQLIEAPGWKLFVYPQGLLSQDIEVGGLTYYVTFPDSNRTRMVADFTINMASVPKESGFRVSALQKPSLIFDTYSYIHVAADPDENVSFSPTGGGGYGWGTDFEFSFTKLPPSDTMKLKGNFNSSDAYLIRATQAEMDAAFGGQLAQIMQATSNYTDNNSFLYFNAQDGSKVGVSFNLFLYRLNFSYLDGGALVTKSAPFSHTTYGVHFKDTVNVGGYFFQDAYWDATAEVYYLDLPGGRVNIASSTQPLFPFNTVLGKSLTTITVPVDPLPGQSPDFKTAHDQVKDNLINSPYQLELGDMDYIFDDQTKTMALNVTVFQNNNAFLARYVYTYTLNSSGIADFVFVEANGNGSLIVDEMSPILDHITNDIFKMDYYTGGGGVLGQFISQDDPGFFFTGTLQ